MPNPSPYDLIQKATRSQTASDRWAALQSSAQTRVAVPAQPQAQEPLSSAQGAEYTAARPAPSMPPVRPASHPELRDPPFPPPQPRHKSIDDIALRHEQARKAAAAMPSVTWKKSVPQGNAPTAPMKAAEKKDE